MRKKIVDQIALGASPEQAARARTLIKGRKNLIDELIAIGFPPGVVLEVCSQVLGIPPAPVHWLKNPKPALAAGIDVVLCRQIGAAPVASTSGRLCIAYADPEMAAQHASLGFPPHQPYLAISTALAKALALLPEDADDGNTRATTAEMPDPIARRPDLLDVPTEVLRRITAGDIDAGGGSDDFAPDSVRTLATPMPELPAAVAPPKVSAPAPAMTPSKAPAMAPATAPATGPALEAGMQARPPSEGMIGPDAPPRPLRRAGSVEGEPLDPAVAQMLVGPLDETRKRPVAPRAPEARFETVPVAPVAPPANSSREPERPRTPPADERSERPRRPPEERSAPMRPLGRGGFQVMSVAEAPPPMAPVPLPTRGAPFSSAPEASAPRPAVEVSSPSTRRPAVEVSSSSMRRPAAESSSSPRPAPEVSSSSTRRPPTRPFEPLDPFVQPDSSGASKRPTGPMAIESVAPPRTTAPVAVVTGPDEDGLGAALATLRVPIGIVVVVVAAVAGFLALREPSEDAPPATPTRAAIENGAMDGKLGDLAARQHDLTSKGNRETDHPKAVLLFDQAIKLSPTAPGARDAFVGRARRSLALGNLDAVEDDLMLLKRRNDIAAIENQIEALLQQLGEARKDTATKGKE